MTKEYPWGKGTPTWERDATPNNSNKTFTVPSGKTRVLKAIEFTLVTTATVGNRNMTVQIGNGAALIMTLEAGAAVAASNQYTALFGTALTRASASAPMRLDTGGTSSLGGIFAIPELILPAEYTIRVYDVSAVDAAADDLTVVLHYIEYDA